MKNSLNYIKLLLLMFCIGGAVSACSDEKEENETPVNPELTIFIHQPYSVNLESHLNIDLQEVNHALLNNPELAQKINIIYFRSNHISGKLYKKEVAKNTNTGSNYVEDKLIYEYPRSQTDYTTFSGLHKILTDIISTYRTPKYGMVIGCHANGWLPTKEDKSSRVAIMKAFGTTKYDIDDTTYKTLAKAIEATGKKFEFILIDDCYSQNIEVAYELRNACKFLIGSVTEIGADGQDYKTAIPNLYAGNYNAICDDAFAYYTNHTWGSSTLSVINCEETEAMATVMKDIYIYPNKNEVKRSSVQVLDGYDMPDSNIGYNIFYDFSDYVHQLCTADKALINRFDTQLQKLIIHNKFTPKFNSIFFDGEFDEYGKKYLRPLNTCCGISCSDLCTEKQTEWKETTWYKATH